MHAHPGTYPHNGYNNGYHHNNQNGYYYHNNAWYGGGGVDVNTWNNDAWYDDGLDNEGDTNVLIGVPDNGYYDPSCQSVQTCNSDGECITQQTCD